MILDTILENKRQELLKVKTAVPLEDIKRGLSGAPPPLDFYKAIDHGGGLRIIAEIKKASPSKGVLRDDFDPVKKGRRRLYSISI